MKQHQQSSFISSYLSFNWRPIYKRPKQHFYFSYQRVRSNAILEEHMENQKRTAPLITFSFQFPKGQFQCYPGRAYVGPGAEQLHKSHFHFSFQRVHANAILEEQIEDQKQNSPTNHIFISVAKGFMPMLSWKSI